MSDIDRFSKLQSDFNSLATKVSFASLLIAALSRTRFQFDFNIGGMSISKIGSGYILVAGVPVIFLSIAIVYYRWNRLRSSRAMIDRRKNDLSELDRVVLGLEKSHAEDASWLKVTLASLSACCASFWHFLIPGLCIFVALASFAQFEVVDISLDNEDKCRKVIEIKDRDGITREVGHWVEWQREGNKESEKRCYVALTAAFPWLQAPGHPYLPGVSDRTKLLSKRPSLPHLYPPFQPWIYCTLTLLGVLMALYGFFQSFWDEMHRKSAKPPPWFRWRRRSDAKTVSDPPNLEDGQTSNHARNEEPDHSGAATKTADTGDRA